MKVSSLKRSVCVGAFGQVGGVISGFLCVVIMSLVSPRDFFDSPIRVAVFTTSCGLIGAIATFSASFSLGVSKSPLVSIPVALGVVIGLCLILKLILSPAGDDSPIGKVFSLVTIVFALCQLAAGPKPASLSDSQRVNGPQTQEAPTKPSYYELSLPRVLRTGLTTALATLVVLLAVLLRLPLLNLFEIDGWGVFLYVVLGFFLGGAGSLGNALCPGT
ncbi:MAG TPA: hypothetical protein VM163_04375 [bacterium]|nr:hypothetical protein [bacterium]